MKNFTVVLFFACIFPSITHAQWKTGNQLLVDIDNDNGVLVIGYIEGVLDNWGGYHGDVKTFASISDETLAIVVVLPDEVSAGQLLNIVRKYLNENPHKTHESAAELVKAAIYTAFAPDRVYACQNALYHLATGRSKNIGAADVACHGVPVLARTR